MQVPKKDRLKTAGIIALMVAGYALFIYRPSVQQQNAMQERVTQLQQQIDGFDQPDLTALRHEADQAQAKLDAVRFTMPQEQEVFLVLDGVTGSLEAQGILDHTASQSDPKWFADYAIQPIHLEFSGDFSEAFAAIQAIETMDRPVRIDRLELVGDTNNTSGHITAVVQLSAFFEGEQGHE